MAASGLDVRGRSLTFESMQVDKHNRVAVDVAKEYAATLGSRGLYVYGPFGTGKTYLAAAIANAVLDSGRWVKFLRVVDMPRNDQDAVDELANEGWPLVVLDDIGAPKSTPRLVECIYNIVDGRLWHGAPLVITSNYRLNALEQKLDEAGGDAGGRVVSRICEACELVCLGGPDRRKR